MNTSESDFALWFNKTFSNIEKTHSAFSIADQAWKECRRRSLLGRVASIEIHRVSEMLKSASKTSFLAAGGTKEDFKVWYKKHCSVNVN